MATRFIGSGRVKEGGFLAIHKQDFNAHVEGGDFLHEASHIQMNPELSDIRLKDATVQGTLEKLSSIIVGNGSVFSFVLDPLETSPIDNVFPDWNSLYTNLPDNGLIDVFVKNSISIPSGEWDLKHRVRFVGINTDTKIFLNGELINVFSFENIKVIKSHYDGYIKWTNDYGTLILKNTSILSEEVNSIISLTDNPDNLGYASFYMINSLFGLNAVEVGEGRKLDIYAYDGSYIESNAISSISSLVSISASIDAEVHDTQDVPGGTVAISRFGVAKNLPYDNTISGLTSTDAQGAIDELSLSLGAKDAVDLSYDPTNSGLVSNNAQDAIDELSLKLGVKDAVDLSYDPIGSGLSSDNAQGALDELAARQIPEDAIDIAYDNGNSGLVADNTQDAIDEIVDNINNIHIPSYTLNSTDIDLSTISSPYNDLIYTIPACLVTRIYEISIILTESIVGLGNVNVRVGSTQGGDDYLIDLVTPIDETSPVGKTVSGLDIATLGSAWIGASKHVTECNENDEIHIQITTDGDITSGKLRVIIRGEIF